jgi:hypothetical protein
VTARTGWFRGQRPVRAGVYEASYQRRRGVFRYWNGRCWFTPSFTVSGAVAQFKKGTLAAHQSSIQWRGLAADPSTSAPQADRRPGLDAMVDYVHRAFYSRNPRLQREARAHAKNLWHLAHPKVAA